MDNRVFPEVPLYEGPILNSRILYEEDGGRVWGFTYNGHLVVTKIDIVEVGDDG